MFVFIKIIKESIIIAFQELYKNKLRSFLSLLGIMIGILCIISVFTAVDSLEKNIKSSIQSLGNNVLYIQKWPWIFSDDYPWWQFYKRPGVTEAELKLIQDQVRGADASALIIYLNGKSLQYRGTDLDGTTVVGASYDYDKIKEMEFIEGRYFSQLESFTGRNSVILGNNVAGKLFTGTSNRVGQTVKLDGHKLQVIGVLKKEGKDVFGFSLDENIILPFSYLKKITNVKSSFGADPLIALKAMPNIPIEELKYEVRGVMRAVRKLHPKEEDNFALNQVSILSEGFDALFKGVEIAGFCIGIFAIIVGGFGIANIMFVSVRERTNIIGIKKALGAKRSYILLEFLIEAIILCVLGGILGLFFVYLIFFLIDAIFLSGPDNNFTFTLSFNLILFGFILSIVTGILAGIIPAILAAYMKPVDAIRGK